MQCRTALLWYNAVGAESSCGFPSSRRRRNAVFDLHVGVQRCDQWLRLVCHTRPKSGKHLSVQRASLLLCVLLGGNVDQYIHVECAG